MCMSTPDIPKPKDPQQAQQPDSAVLTDKAKRNRANLTGGSLLTSTSGAPAPATSRSTLLGQ